MIEAFLTDIFLAILVFSGTVVAGTPYIFLFLKRGRFFTKLLLSFVIGYILIALVGILSEIVHIDPLFPELLPVLIGLLLTIKYKEIIKLAIELDHYDRIVLALMALYAVILIAYFANIIMWMAGDAAGHASILRLLIDGNAIPISIAPFGDYWNIYPKAFHLYTYLWAKGGGVLSTIQTLPVLLTAMTPALLYSVLREYEQQEIALYVFALSCFCFPQHYIYLIWGGYPSLTAEMLLVSAILFVIVDRRFLPLVLIAIAFTHTRFLVYILVILVFWQGFSLLQQNYSKVKEWIPVILATAGVGFFFFVHFNLIRFNQPDFLIGIFTNQEMAQTYISQWFFGVLSLFGIIIAFSNRNKKTELLAFGWFFAILFVFLICDTNIFTFQTAEDRILSKLYLPIALFAGMTMGVLTQLKENKKFIFPFLAVLLILGSGFMGGVFLSYKETWGLPTEDFQAIMWIKTQDFSENTVCINVDGTGEWVYPLSGIRVVNNNYYPDIEPVGDKSWAWITSALIQNASSDRLLSTLSDATQHYDNVLIFLSRTTIEQPGYIPPFSRYYGQRYNTVELINNPSVYRNIYRENTQIYQIDG